MQANRKDHIFFTGVSVFLLPFIVVFALTGQWVYLLLPFVFFLFYIGWQSFSFVYFLLIASIPWSTEIYFGDSMAMNFPDEPLMLLASALFIATLFYLKGNSKLIDWRHPLLWLAGLHFAWIILTASFSTNFIISLKYTLAKGWYIIAFLLFPLLFIQNKIQIKRIALLFSISLFVITLVILAKHAMDDFLFMRINNAVTPFFRNHVNYSAMLVCSLPLWFAMYRLNNDNGILKKWIIVVIIIILGALIFAFSRGAWLAIITGAIAYILIRYKILWQTFVAGILLTTAFIFWLKSEDRYLGFAHDFKTTIFHTDFKEHLAATYQLKDVSTAERFNRWIAAVRMVPESPLVGVGPGTFTNNYKSFSIPAFKTWVSDNEEKSTVHNYFLLLITEQGWPGLFFFLLLLTAVFYYAQYFFHRLQDLFYKEMILAVASIMVMIITLNFLSDLIETDKIGSLFFSCIAFLIIAGRQVKKEAVQVVD